MSKFQHREPGLVGAAMRFRDVFGEINRWWKSFTLDALNNYYTVKGPNYAVTITDSLMVKGLPVGTKVLFGGNEIELYPDGSAHLTETKGWLDLH